MEYIATNFKQLWFGKFLPSQHISFNFDKEASFNAQKLRTYFRRGIYHPVKRKLAKYYLIYLRRFFKLKVIGITGSAGKTTTKEMLTSILKTEGKTVSSYKNIDPVYNIPDTILKARARTKYLVLEMGVEFPGEMDFYLWLARPDIAVITNIYPTHTEFFKNVEGVGREKTKLIKRLGRDDISVLNFQDINLRKDSESIKSKMVWFNRKDHIYARNIKYEADFTTSFDLNIYSKKKKIFLPMLGRQFVENALAASAASDSLGISIENIKKGLEKYELPDHRMKFIKTRLGAVLVDDSYNNNPEAAKRTIEAFSEIAQGKKKIIVFGDMLELGERKEDYHREIGEFILKNNPDYLIGVGELSKITVDAVGKNMGRDKAIWTEKLVNAKKILSKIMDSNSYVLIKGSRSIGLDRLVDELS